MHHAALVGVGQRIGDLHRVADRCLDRQPICPNYGAQGFAFHQFHGDVVQPVFFAGVEDHHDIGVSEQAGGACFGLEPRQEFVMLQAGTFFA